MRKIYTLLTAGVLLIGSSKDLQKDLEGTIRSITMDDSFAKCSYTIANKYNYKFKIDYDKRDCIKKFNKINLGNKINVTYY